MTVEKHLGPGDDKGELEKADKLLKGKSILTSLEIHQRLGIKIPRDKLDKLIREAEIREDDLAKKGFDNMIGVYSNPLKEYRKKYYPNG
jgi:hypothetical protein